MVATSIFNYTLIQPFPISLRTRWGYTSLNKKHTRLFSSVPLSSMFPEQCFKFRLDDIANDSPAYYTALQFLQVVVSLLPVALLVQFRTPGLQLLAALCYRSGQIPRLWRLQHTFGSPALFTKAWLGIYGPGVWKACCSGLELSPPPSCGGSRSLGSFVFCAAAVSTKKQSQDRAVRYAQQGEAGL